MVLPVRGVIPRRSRTLPGKGLGMCPNNPIFPQDWGTKGVDSSQRSRARVCGGAWLCLVSAGLRDRLATIITMI
jgi:hypothetical protein